MVEIAGGLDAPLGFVHAGDGSARMFIVEQGGVIKVFDDGRVLPEPFLDLTDVTEGGGEQGLLGLAFHPEYDSAGRFFVNYTDLNGDTVVAEYRRDSPTQADPSSGRTLLTVDQPYSNHNGGHLDFGPDGYLYIGLGDGGSGGDPHGNGQSLDTLLGKLLRIDVSESGDYSIPRDNPFADGGGRQEIWAYGLRNPWRFSFDTATRSLWIGDVGQSAQEEINRVEMDAPGLNFGWNRMEGDACYAPPSGCEGEDLVLPAVTYSHDDGCSVTGGHVYRGTEQPELRGAYFYGDYCSGKIWVVDASRLQPGGAVELLDTELSISSFGVGASGELHIVDLGGAIYRVETD